MGSNILKSPKLGHSAESSDIGLVSELSAILVATIQEAKERNSQIEYIFCSQLFPKFQSLHKTYSEAKETAELKHKEKEQTLLLQITKSECEKQQVMEENQLLKLEKAMSINMESQLSNSLKELQEELEKKAIQLNEGMELQQNMQKLLESNASLVHNYEKTIQELEGKNIMLQEKQNSLEVDLIKKSKVVDELMELKNKLLIANQTKASLIEQKEVQLKGYVDKAYELYSEVESVEKKVDELHTKPRFKTEEVDKEKEVQENFLKKVEYQSLKIMNKEELLDKCERKNILLSTQIEELLTHVNELQEVLNKKNNELEDGRKVQEQLHKQIDSFHTGKMKRWQGDEYEKERKLLLDKQRGLEEKVGKLQQSLSKRSKESYEGMELHGKLLKQIEAKNCEVQSEKRKRRDLFDSYKSLKSQYVHLCNKYGHTSETMLPQDKKKDESEKIQENGSPVTFHVNIDKNKTSKATTEIIKRKDEQELLQGEKKVTFLPSTSPVSPSTSTIPIAPECPVSIKTCPPAGAKRPVSYWRDTRSHQNRSGPDPHDDFLDTPLQNMRGNSGKAMKKENNDRPNPSPGKEVMPPPKAVPSGFKYVETVRKKSERESLKGVECKQCKKFYDAVNPEEGKRTDGRERNVQCEHHDGVSRHRYRYAPPCTPEGFWNIGFESEI